MLKTKQTKKYIYIINLVLAINHAKPNYTGLYSLSSRK